MKETTKNYSKRKKVNNMFESESVYISPDTTEPHVDMGHEDIGVWTCIFSTSVDCLPNNGSSTILSFRCFKVFHCNLIMQKKTLIKICCLKKDDLICLLGAPVYNQ